jgi:polysaccharide export outer membrane protein
MFRLYVIAALLGASCATVGNAQSARAYDPVQAAIPAVDPQAPRPGTTIGPLDSLSINVFREPELSVEQVLVDESGRVLLPLVGPVSAAGKSTETLASEIAERLRKYVRDPQVAVAVKQSAKRQITVAGSVMQPGSYALEGRTTLLQAVALARGPSQVASLKQTLIFRTIGGRRTAAKFDLDAIARGTAPDPEVLAGDTVAIGNSKMKTAWRDVVTSVRAFNIFSLIP